MGDIHLNKLYRGQNLFGHLENNGVISAKGDSFSRSMKINEPMATFGNECTIGPSEKNSVISHQYDSNQYPTAGISTTPLYERALFYATSGGRNDGVIYVISRCKMTDHGIKEFDVNRIVRYPKLVMDQEVILVPISNTLPAEVIIEVIMVEAESVHSTDSSGCQ